MLFGRVFQEEEDKSTAHQSRQIEYSIHRDLLGIKVMRVIPSTGRLIALYSGAEDFAVGP